MSENKTEIVAASEAVLQNTEWILVLDHSGSMAEPSTQIKGHSRYDEVREEAILTARIAEKHGATGITLIHFSNKATMAENVKADDVAATFAKYSPNGSTDLAAALLKAEEKARRAGGKDVVVFVYTDGMANDPDACVDAINRAGREFGRPKIGFVFIQVGNDSNAQAFLDKLDNELKVDVCATFSEEQAENITIEQLVTAARTE